MDKKLFGALMLVLVLLVVATVRVVQYSQTEAVPVLEVAQSNELPMTTVSESQTEAQAVTERYTGQVDRVEVIFEQTDFTSYRLITNGVIRSGELNTERGFADDSDATVYVLNWQDPSTVQRYVRLTAEPTRLYLLDSEQNIVRSSVLTLQ